MIVYRGYEVTLDEQGGGYDVVDAAGELQYSIVAGPRTLVFRAATRFGDSYALGPEDAVEGARRLIDRGASTER